MEQELKKPVVAVQRGIAIIKLLSGSKEPMGIHEIARALDIVPSTCMHILRTLAHEGMISFDEGSKKYRLGSLILRLARDLSGTNDFIQDAQPLLDQIAKSHHVTAAAAWLESNDRVVVVANSPTPSNFGISVNIGSRFPSFASAAGHCIAAFSDVSEDVLRHHFDQVNWARPPVFENWIDEVQKVQNDGYAVDRGQFMDGVTIFASPVLDTSGKPTRFIAAIGFSQTLLGETGEKLGASLKETADSISNIYS